MKLLTEIYDPFQLIVEGEGAEKKYYLQGLMLEFDAQNKNGRRYRSDWHDPSVQKYITEKVDGKRAWGELDHPDGATINLKNVSHRIVEMHKEGNNWFGKSIISNEGMGCIVKGLLATGGTLGSSSRGVGSLKEVNEGLMEVQQDYKIITPSDIVSDPSAHGALMQGIMENVEYLYDEKIGFYTEEVKKKINKLSINEIADKKVAIFESFLKEISSQSFLRYK